MRRLFFELRYLIGRAPWDSGVSPPELQAFLAQAPPGRALDLGCGTGTNAITMARGGWQVTALDFSLGAIVRARCKAQRAGVAVDFRQADVANLSPIEGPFDLALDIGCYHSLSPAQQSEYAAQLLRLLCPGGTFLLYTFLASFEARSSRPSEADVRRHFGTGFELQDLAYGQDRGRPSAWFTFRRKK
jgi:SAM-dependent methyltransferase